MIANRFLSGRALALNILCAGALLLPVILTGCERKEKVLDIKTPGADVEVERSLDTGRIDVDVQRKK